MWQKLSQYVVKFSQYVIKLSQYVAKLSQYVVKLFQYVIKLFQYVVKLILSKSESPRSPDSADKFEFSAERLSENAKSIKIMLFAELLTVISPIYVQSLQ